MTDARGDRLRTDGVWGHRSQEAKDKFYKKFKYDTPEDKKYNELVQKVPKWYWTTVVPDAKGQPMGNAGPGASGPSDASSASSKQLQRFPANTPAATSTPQNAFPVPAEPAAPPPKPVIGEFMPNGRRASQADVLSWENQYGPDAQAAKQKDAASAAAADAAKKAYNPYVQNKVQTALPVPSALPPKPVIGEFMPNGRRASRADVLGWENQYGPDAQAAKQKDAASAAAADAAKKAYNPYVQNKVQEDISRMKFLAGLTKD